MADPSDVIVLGSGPGGLRYATLPFLYDAAVFFDSANAIRHRKFHRKPTRSSRSFS